MKIILSVIMAVAAILPAKSREYNYVFRDIAISEAIVRISKDHPDVNISFIYKELDNYRTSATIDTDDAYEALRLVVGKNPISVIKKGNNYYIEALQHGIFRYEGRVVDGKDEPVAGVSVTLLSPEDSTVVTYGVTDSAGRFAIPCDRQEVIAKFTCIGYNPVYKKCDSFAIGSIVIKELPVQLQAVNVEADNTVLLTDKSVFRPTPSQKSASQTGIDLLMRMAIPQLNVRIGSSNVSTSGGESVALYIDYVPATDDDIRMMRMSDVRSVEYLENPSDPRFQGNRNVVNFRMVQYEYGGYVKALGTENFIANSGLAQVNARLVRNRMTYDIMGYGYYMANDHMGMDQIETFRLPTDEGKQVCFSRESITEKSKYRKHDSEASLRALYAGDRVTANSQVSMGLDNNPHNDNSGSVQYSDNRGERSTYESVADSRAKYINYRGYYYISLSEGNSLTVSADYAYSHTDQSSRYTESAMTAIYNGASDDTHSGNMRMSYGHSFSDRHSILAHVRGLLINNRTDYTGSVNQRDHSVTIDGQTGISYRYTHSKFSASAGYGWEWGSSRLNDTKSSWSFPYVDASLRWVPDNRNSLSAVFHYSVWPPSSNYKSANMIHISPFVWHTGNPQLKSHRSYDIGIFYTHVPSNRFSITTFATSWLVGNRSAFVYEATEEGVVRTIEQPIGSLGHYNYGINATTVWLDGRLYVSGSLDQLFVHNGRPYNTDRSNINYYLQALYYLGKFNFAMAYQSASATDNYNSMSGIWSKNKDKLTFQAGWSNTVWNMQLTIQNIQRWNWRATNERMLTDCYSIDRWVSNASSHAFVRLSATYTFGFGRKIKRDGDIVKQSGASSGILK